LAEIVEFVREHDALRSAAVSSAAERAANRSAQLEADARRAQAHVSVEVRRKS